MQNTSPPISADLEVPMRPLTALQQGAIALGMVAMGIGMTINFVVVTPLARDAGLTELEVAGVLTVSALLFAVMTPIWGRWGDRYGRKRVMIFSLLAAAATNGLFAIALKTALAGLVVGLSAFLMLAAVRTLFGLLSPGMFPASMGAMIEATTPRTRAAGLGLMGTA
ncbi:MAG: MFS transporter, partial [Pseudomonadota bacterium]